MGTIVAIHVAAFEYNLYSSGDDTMVQRSDCCSVCYFVGRTIEIGNGESKAGGMEGREGFKSLFRGVSRCGSPSAGA